MEEKWVFFHEYGDYKIFVDIPFEKIKVKFGSNESPEVFKANPFEISRKECQEISNLNLKQSFSYSLKEKSKKNNLERVELNHLDYKKAKASVLQNPEIAFNIHDFLIKHKSPENRKIFLMELYEVAGASLAIKSKKDKEIEIKISKRIIESLKVNKGFSVVLGEILKYAPDNFELLESFLTMENKNLDFDKLLTNYSNLSPETFKKIIKVWMSENKSLRLHPLESAFKKIVQKKMKNNEEYFGYTDAIVELYKEGFFPKNVCGKMLLFSIEKEIIPFEFLDRYKELVDPLKFYKAVVIPSTPGYKEFFNWLEKAKPGYLKKKINDFLIFNGQIFRHLDYILEEYRESIDCNLVKQILYPDLNFIRKFPEMVDFNLVELERISNFSKKELEKLKPYIEEQLFKKIEEYKEMTDV